ncbi:MAG: hypothetical protein Q8Q42_02820 [Nanoarchaeota archaeon]|nr:hypothetical protein [Nanoarchaeota archaeon]
MKYKKGISPLIATVLLIGFAVALAAVVMTWGLDFIQNTAANTEKQTKNTLICASDLTFAISDVDKMGKTITVDNRGQVNIKSVIFRVYTDGAVTTLDSSVDALGETGVNKFEVKQFINIDPLSSTSTKVEAIATVSGDSGEGDIVCQQNIQSYILE